MPGEMAKHGHNIEANLRKRKLVEPEQKRFYGPYPKEFYPVDWDRDRESLLLVGPPNLGKTQFARYLLGDCYYIRSSLEPLRTCKFDKPLLFDEVSMLESPPAQSLEITDVVDGGGIKMRYRDVAIPPGVQRIFCHNMLHPFQNPNSAVYERRVRTHQIDGPAAAEAAALAAAASAKVSAAAA
jgi:hypothetical protein